MCFSLNLESSTGVSESMTYAGIVYYEEKGVEDLVTFTAAKNLNALLEVIVITNGITSSSCILCIVC